MKSRGIIKGKPCKRCGKTLRHDYGGVCMDCADDLGISEMFERNPKYEANLKRATKKYGLKDTGRYFKKEGK